MNQLTFALIYFLFAWFFLTSNLDALGIPASSAIWNAVMEKFEKPPFSLTPEQYINDIQTPSDIYSWSVNVFVPQLFVETSKNGDESGYCTE